MDQVTILAVAVVIVVVIQGVWLAYLTYRMWKDHQEKEKEKARQQAK